MEIFDLNYVIKFMFRREDCIDVEIKASGLTKQMEKDLLREMGIIEIDEDEEIEEEYKENMDEESRSINNSESNNLRPQVENSVRSELTYTSEETFINAVTNEERNLFVSSAENIIAEGVKNIDICNSNENMINSNSHNLNMINNEETNSFFTTETFNSDDEHVEIEKLNDSKSMYSTTTAATIAPEIIKKKVKAALQKREKREQSRRILVKGEANAITRIRRENTDTIKQSTGIWGWE